jgi:pimeloyl-ACP methyl ester carboxylesterase
VDRAGLVYELRNGEDPAHVVLPGAGLGEDALLELAGAARARALLVEPPRIVYLGREAVARRWYVDNIDRSIEPATFADALGALERFVQAVCERWGAPVLVGAGQGGELALALAVLTPEALAGVVAVDAGIPRVSGWHRPPRQCRSLPIRLIARRRRRDGPTVKELERLGATVAELYCGARHAQDEVPLRREEALQEDGDRQADRPPGFLEPPAREEVAEAQARDAAGRADLAG